MGVFAESSIHDQQKSPINNWDKDVRYGVCRGNKKGVNKK